MRSIGEMARASGLNPGTLRFYDSAGVFVPAAVDPHTGYRWYAEEQLPDARLLARLRRVGLPLAGITRVLTGSPAEARAELDAHLRRLEDGLTDARRELSAVRCLLDSREFPVPQTRLTVPAPALAAALDAVRFAAPADAALPAVAGIFLDAEDGVLHLVATDRYRLAVADCPAALSGPPASALLPTALADAARALLADAEEAELTLDGGLFTIRAAGRSLSGERAEADFPDYRRLLRLEPTHRVTLTAADLRALPEDDGSTTLTATVADALPDASSPADLLVHVNREFLLQAAGTAEQLVLELGGPIAPLAIRFPSRADTFSLLMPIAR
ncbi:DNA polymerase III subunit beta family protein [Kitasatospora cineracea]|uniref:DNA polymerase III beta subunit-like protein n=1 Tax=Kitasatospora cineracea TaxID=88074 RepID=A0A3N4RNM1_9ACTN|nr:MerR family transcriptional regulator [Kitasatospora cineracea]RPE35012.1 DNA polymerase III beta subunit-like protein [Kitasatospora cineracea]